MRFVLLCALGACAAAFAPRNGIRRCPSFAAPQRRTRRYAGAEEVLSEESVERVLEEARLSLSSMFDSPENNEVGITGTVEFVELEGPTVIVRLGGRFWHARSDVLTRVESFLMERIPEICEVAIEDAAQLDDADKRVEKPDY